jgi:Ni,Fe-hydrogenase I small subunit
MATRELTHDESIEALRETVERAQSLAQEYSAEELANDAEMSTGACCLYTYGVSSCTSGITQTACARAAANTGTMYKFTAGKSCSQVRCP